LDTVFETLLRRECQGWEKGAKEHTQMAVESLLSSTIGIDENLCFAVSKLYGGSQGGLWGLAFKWSWPQSLPTLQKPQKITVLVKLLLHGVNLKT